MSHIRTHITLHYSNNMYTCKVLTGLLLKGTRPSWKSVYPKVGSGHVPFESVLLKVSLTAVNPLIRNYTKSDDIIHVEYDIMYPSK